MKTALLALFSLWSISAIAGNPRSWYMGGQFGSPSGHLDNYSYMNPSTGATKYVQLATIAPGNAIIRMCGTFTVRAPGEVLMQVMCNGYTIWAGETRCYDWDKPTTLVIDVPFPQSWNMCGQIYVWYQSDTFYGLSYADGEFWEYQLVLQGA